LYLTLAAGCSAFRHRQLSHARLTQDALPIGLAFGFGSLLVAVRRLRLAIPMAACAARRKPLMLGLLDVN